MPANPNDPRVLAIRRRMSAAERARAGIDLQAMAERLVDAGVRREHADWDDNRVRGEVRRRFERSRALYNGTKSSPV